MKRDEIKSLIEPIEDQQLKARITKALFGQSHTIRLLEDDLTRANAPRPTRPPSEAEIQLESDRKQSKDQRQEIGQPIEEVLFECPHCKQEIEYLSQSVDCTVTHFLRRDGDDMEPDHHMGHTSNGEWECTECGEKIDEVLFLGPSTR